ncbi:MAG: aspartate--tRNA ligase [candidate division Zixibacteria bacterium]|nr:aspartate--tRNA ligase [candidate division Zixibacteria bacterium]
MNPPSSSSVKSRQTKEGTFSLWKRTHNLGELRPENIGQAVRLNGWVNQYRNLGGLLFLDLRDRYGITQVVLNPARVSPEIFEKASSARHEFVVAVIGEVIARPDGTRNKNIRTGEIEVVAEDFTILNECPTPPFEITDEAPSNENLRLEYRYLDLRRRPMQEIMRIRHEIALAVRESFSGMGFYEIETPLLMRSTPEGARDYVVPSRVHRGKFYALPQSPQLLKQILMVSGFDKYFQLARCLRDEDLRSDRQPEHTQIDIEMSFVTPDDIFSCVERMLKYVFEKVQGVDVETPFQRFTYADVMSRYGVDKPDMRYAMEIIDLTEKAGAGEFGVFNQNIANGGVVKGITLSGGGNYTRRQLDELTEFAKSQGAGGMAYILRPGEEFRSPILKFFSDEQRDDMLEFADCKQDDLLVIVSDSKEIVEKVLGQLRIKLAKEHNLADKKKFAFVWVTQFPLFDYDEETDSWDAMHNIVSHPLEDNLSLLDEGENTDLAPTDPEHPWRRILANQYDLVLNGNEIASGGIRINKRELQEKVLNILGISTERADRMFGFLLRALEYGAPPHGGVALGLDRLVAIMCGVDSIREVIAFPKTASASALMEGAPSELDQEQLDELGIVIKGS